ncbi:EAL domain-containing protein [Cronbergia sp. UHCC 0137]|uniref:EAL domain-containing protein n=1 Tax=Cronbergia sp. UHCC 0137 TaxID=3110239 RepID=UPI002B1EE7B6|nr:EAL domain-containing protein [Cronbergia sp. UHCC 0137]MEA5617000.1 EAL domain-containing protein [Cronbergia sp. UHCC 0137]
MPEKEREKIRHWLVVQDLQGQRIIPLLEATYSLGRDPRNAIVLNSPSVSRQHAILLRVTVPKTDQYSFRIIDGNFKGKRSTNGLFVNGTKCFAHHLQHGDIIAFGNPHIYAKYHAISSCSEQAMSELSMIKLSDCLPGIENPFNSVLPNNIVENPEEAALTRLASFPELIPNAIIEMDLEGTITYLNPAAALKFPHLREFGKEHPILAQLLNIVETLEINSFVREVEINGEIFEQSVHYLPESELIRTFIIREITEQKKAQAELKQRDRLLQAVAEATNYLLAEMDYDKAIEKVLAVLGEAANVDRVYLFQNHPHPVTAEMAVSLRFEWTKAGIETSRHHWQNQSYQTSGLNRWYDHLSTGQSINGLTQTFPPSEKQLLNQHNIQSLLLVSLRLEEKFWGYIGFADCTSERYWSKHEESSLLTMAASISGVRQRQQVEEKMRYQALHDLLTGLPNRRQFNDLLAKAIYKAILNQQSLAVIFLDLDRFKIINDTLGHTIGDELLQTVAHRLTKCISPGNILARWGGDEFTILLSQIINSEQVTQIAQKILQALEHPFYLNEHELYVSASLGISLLDESSPDAETLIKHADAALYYAKDEGRNNYQFYKKSLNTKTPELLSLEKSLRHALDKDELKVYYQPQVNMVSGKITGMEALLRWHHTDMGIIAPNVFIPLAEENGLIISIGEWVMRKACIQNKAWQAEGLPFITMSVNLSPKQFRQPNLLKTVAGILSETSLEPQFLELEITETTAIEDISFTQNLLKNLEKMGVHISIDDFGTGHSSLSRLQVLPFHKLKIDKSFIQELTKDEKVAFIVKAIVNLGQSLGLKITAEGAEKVEEIEFLRSINCDDVQGFFFYKALSAQQATEALRLNHYLRKT